MEGIDLFQIVMTLVIVFIVGLIIYMTIHDHLVGIDCKEQTTNECSEYKCLYDNLMDKLNYDIKYKMCVIEEVRNLE